MDKIKLEILGLSSSQSQSGSFALVLGEDDGDRRLPIIIGMFEAQAIAIEIEKITPNRPMTHDLFGAFAKSFDFAVEEIVISDLKEGVFYAKIVCTDGVKNKEIDARPSDAIAIGLRFGVPIFTFETILSEAGIVLSDYSEEEREKEAPVRKATKSRSVEDGFKNTSSEELRTMLDEALGREEYERAAKIRDELNRRN
ncbi:MAG: bifunctional nuclease family protein [Catalinimonas sp.]